MLSFTAAKSQTLETNIPNIVIKNYQCSSVGKTVSGILVNRNQVSYTGSLRVRIIDPEGDILWQASQPININAQNGSNFSTYIQVGFCNAPNKVQLILER